MAGPYPRRYPPRRDQGPPINERVLQYREIRVVGADGEQLGIMPTRQALELSRAAGLDLVVVAPTATPVVCRIIDYGRHKYETEKRDKENKKKVQDVKGIKIRPNIAEHDLQTLLKRSREFLLDGDKVRVLCQFRAREITHPEIGQRKLERFAELLAEISIVEKAAALDGKQMVMVLLPKPNNAPPSKKGKNAENQDKQDSSEEV